MKTANRRAEILSLSALGVVALAAFLPWVSIFGINVSGIKGDGQLTLGLAVIGLVVLLLSASLTTQDHPKVPRRVGQIVGIVAASLVLLIGLADYTNFAGIGIYLTIMGGAAWLGGAIWDLCS